MICTFQSTLPQGERPQEEIQHQAQTGHFNPRSRKGSDTLLVTPSLTCPNFNPRSRKGSDFLWHILYQFQKNFNPRSRKGSDATSTFLFARVYAFQSTLPQGERRAVHKLTKKTFCHFNPRSRKGSDQIRPRFLPRQTISIHAPARGAT